MKLRHLSAQFVLPEIQLGRLPNGKRITPAQETAAFVAMWIGFFAGCERSDANPSDLLCPNAHCVASFEALSRLNRKRNKVSIRTQYEIRAFNRGFNIGMVVRGFVNHCDADSTSSRGLIAA